MFLFENERNMKTRIERSEIRVTNLGGLEVCRGSVGEVWGRCVGVCWGASGCVGVCRGVSGRCVGEGMMLEGWNSLRFIIRIPW